MSGIVQDPSSGRWYVLDENGERKHGPYLDEQAASAAASPPAQLPWSKPRLPKGQLRIQYTKAGGQGAAKLNVPAAIARLIHPEAVFQPELTEEGILYRYVGGQVPPELPRWMTDGES